MADPADRLGGVGAEQLGAESGRAAPGGAALELDRGLLAGPADAAAALVGRDRRGPRGFRVAAAFPTRGASRPGRQRDGAAPRPDRRAQTDPAVAPQSPGARARHRDPRDSRSAAEPAPAPTRPRTGLTDSQ